MISKLFKKPTPADLLQILKAETFNENKANNILKNFSINDRNSNEDNFLHTIIPENRIESVRWLIKKSININAVNFNKETPLMIASAYGYVDTIKALVDASANLDFTDKDGLKAIHRAIKNNHFNAYLILKKHSHDISAKDINNKTLLHYAVDNQNLEIINDLLTDKRFKISKDILFYSKTYENSEILNKILSKFNNLDMKDEKGKNILFYIVQNGLKGEDVLKDVLNKGLDINSLDSQNNTLLIHLIKEIIHIKRNEKVEYVEDIEKNQAVIENLLNLIPVLLEEAIDTTICNKEGENILTIAANSNNTQILSKLFEYGVEPNIPNGFNETALSIAAMKGPDYTETVTLLLDYGASANIKDDEGKTIVEKLINAQLVTRNNKPLKDSQKRLLNKNIDYSIILEGILVNSDVNLTQLNSNKEPYLFDSVAFNNLDLVKLLIKQGADINQTDINGINILYKFMEQNKSFRKEAEQKRFYHNLKTLITMGANVNSKDSFGGITLHKAILDGDLQTVKILLHGGADINAIDNRGRNMIHNSIWKNNVKIFRMMYSYNKQLLNDPDKFGVLPINYAAFLGYTDLVLELMETGAHVNNPYRKTPYIINFVRRFHKNLDLLIENARTKVNKNKLKILVENMKKEFLVE